MWKHEGGTGFGQERNKSRNIVMIAFIKTNRISNILIRLLEDENYRKEDGTEAPPPCTSWNNFRNSENLNLDLNAPFHSWFANGHTWDLVGRNPSCTQEVAWLLDTLRIVCPRWSRHGRSTLVTQIRNNSCLSAGFPSAKDGTRLQSYRLVSGREQKRGKNRIFKLG